MELSRRLLLGDPTPMPTANPAAAQIAALQAQVFGEGAGGQHPIEKAIVAAVPPPPGSSTWSQDDWLNYAQSYAGREWFAKRVAASRQARPTSTPAPGGTPPPGAGVDVGETPTWDVESRLIKQTLDALGRGEEAVLPMGKKYIILSKDFMGRPKKIELPRTQETGKGRIEESPDGTAWWLYNADGGVQVVAKPKPPTPPVGTQFDWTKSEAGVRYATEQATLADERADQTKLETAEIEADTTLAKADKDRLKQEVIENAAKDINKANNAFNQWKAQLESQEKQLDRQAQESLARGNWQLAREQLASAEKIAAAKAQVDREVAALNAYGSLLAVESQERGRRAEAAASVFKTLAELAPQDQLRSAFYLMRGVAPPPSATTQIPPGLMAALGVNPDTAAAAAQQLRGATAVPPWLSRLMGGQAT